MQRISDGVHILSTFHRRARNASNSHRMRCVLAKHRFVPPDRLCNQTLNTQRGYHLRVARVRPTRKILSNTLSARLILTVISFYRPSVLGCQGCIRIGPSEDNAQVAATARSKQM